MRDINTDIELQIEFIKDNLKQPLVLIGLMGAGKTAIGRMLAARLDYHFVDSDDVIVEREKRSIPQIFGPNNVNEREFRKIEQNVITDLMTSDPQSVISTGGGAYMNAITNQAIELYGKSVFLRADLEILLDRVGDGEGRPLLKDDPRGKLEELISLRYPVYSRASIIVDSDDQTKEEMRDRVITALYSHLNSP